MILSDPARRILYASLMILILSLIGILSPKITKASTHPLIGVHIHPTWDTQEDRKQLDLAHSIGADLVRIGVTWHLLEPRQGQYDLAWYVPQLDQLVRDAESRNLKILMMLGQTPCWAAPDYCTGGQQFTWCPRARPTEYANALAFLVRRYGNRVQAWEVWNEPNLTQFWCEESNPRAAEYVTLLQHAYTAIKQVNNSASVLGGSIAGADTEYLRAFYTSGGGSYYDVLSLHPYSGTASPDDCSNPRWSYSCGVENVRNTMLANNDRRPIWFTEFGWSSFSGEGGISETSQASYLTESLDLAQAWDYVPVAIWYTLTDIPNQSSNREGHFGLFREDLTPKPVVNSFQAFAQRTSDSTAPINNCLFFTETAGGHGGFTVCDDEQARFRSAFQNWGLQNIGYPISQRYARDGFVTQAFQKAIMQWRPESNTVALVNIFDDLHNAGFDETLLRVRQTPPQLPADWDDPGLSFNQIIQRRQALLNTRPALRRTYFASTDPLNFFGLPTSEVIDMGNHYAIRLQRAVLQEWKENVPWARAGQVTIANGGDIAKELGALPSEALVPSSMTTTP